MSTWSKRPTRSRRNWRSSTRLASFTSPGRGRSPTPPTPCAPRHRLRSRRRLHLVLHVVAELRVDHPGPREVRGGLGARGSAASSRAGKRARRARGRRGDMGPPGRPDAGQRDCISGTCFEIRPGSTNVGALQQERPAVGERAEAEDAHGSQHREWTPSKARLREGAPRGRTLRFGGIGGREGP